MVIRHMILELRKFFFSTLEGGGRVMCGTSCHSPPPPKNSNMILELGTFSLSNFLVVVVGVGSATLFNPPPPPQNSNMIFGLRKCQLGRIGTYLCKSVCACACTCVYAHMHIHGGGPDPPTPLPHKYFKPNSYYKQSYSPLCFLM